MARTVNLEEFSSKRSEILDAAQRLVFRKGFEQMAIQDILKELSISSGAFHHYFGSRAALLEAFIARIKQDSGQPLLPIVYDPHLTAIEKLQGFLNTLERVRINLKAEVIAAGRVWYADGNAVVRLKVDEAIFEQRSPLVAEIVRQGNKEGVFAAVYAEQAGEVILSLLQGMGNTHARLMLSVARVGVRARSDDLFKIIEKVVVTYAAYMEAIERVLGAPPNSLHRTDADAVRVWVNALQESGLE